MIEADKYTLSEGGSYGGSDQVDARWHGEHFGLHRHQGWPQLGAGAPPAAAPTRLAGRRTADHLRRAAHNRRTATNHVSRAYDRSGRAALLSAGIIPTRLALLWDANNAPLHEYAAVVSSPPASGRLSARRRPRWDRGDRRDLGQLG